MSTASRPGGSLPATLQRRLRRQLTVFVFVAAAFFAGWFGVLVAPILDRILLVVVSYALTVSLVDFFRRE